MTDDMNDPMMDQPDGEPLDFEGDADSMPDTDAEDVEYYDEPAYDAVDEELDPVAEASEADIAAEDPEAYLDTLVDPVELPPQAYAEADNTADAFIDDLLATSTAAAAGARLSRTDDDRPVYVAPTYTPAIALPPMTTIRRGRLGSVVPALALIGIGAWLTLTLTSGGTVETPLLLIVVLSAVILSLLAQWLGSGRWSRGTVVTALVIVAIVALFALPLVPGMLPFSQMFPLMASAVGAAIILSGVLVRPAQPRALIPGLLLIVMGIAGTLLTTGVLPAEIGTTLAPLWAIPVVILAAIWLVPLVFRRRRGS